MTEFVRVAHDGAGLELVLDGAAGGAGALGHPEMRAALLAQLTDIAPDTRFVLIRGATPQSFAGPDLPDRKDQLSPTLAELCAAVEGCPVPVVVLAEGAVSGRGAEFLLAAHVRLASPKAVIGFSSAQLGLLPQAGTSLRLPRLIGAEQALRLLRGARAISGAEALALGLFDKIIDRTDPAEVLALARQDAGGMTHPRPSLGRDDGLRDGRGFLQAVAQARQGLEADALPSERALVDCIEAAMLLPPQQALEFEDTLAAEIAAAPEAAALCHIFRAERRAAQVPQGLAGFSAAPVRHLGVAGAEAALSGLVLTALARGLTVTLANPSREKLVAFLETVAARQETAVKSGQLTEVQRDADWARLNAATETAVLGACDLIITNAETPLPARPKPCPVLVVGRGALPAGAFRLILCGRATELALPPSSAGPLALTAWAFLRRMGMQVVLTGQQVPAGISGRLSAAGAAAIRALAELGVASEDLAGALRAYGVTAAALPQVSPPAARAMSGDEIRARWLAALGNEAARLLQSGMTKSAADIDLMAVVGLGFPRRLGGPLHQADAKGVLILRRDLAAWASDAPVWAPVPALDALASLGRGFAGAVRPE